LVTINVLIIYYYVVYSMTVIFLAVSGSYVHFYESGFKALDPNPY